MIKGIIRVLSYKGGVGKTSISLALARIISLSSYKVLVYDMDNLFTISKLTESKECEINRHLTFDVYHCNKHDNKFLTLDYDYVIVDTYPGILTNELPKMESEKIFNIFITDYFSLVDTLEYIKLWEDVKVTNLLVVNLISLDEEDQNYINQTPSLSYNNVIRSIVKNKNVKVDHITIIPFIKDYYGSYKIDFPKVESLVGRILF
ncbi:hypothetical protein BFU36_09905 [Sulfolobus sp. A20]|uniref:nucleotide-binding protein n=1 Tax=Saccharolobus sp. A20 TaxID=1891280 RepID=UPI00084602E4|nr:AAA family ATPase [Sulfolobus sp. A20]AOL16971.1 hypothetical protein BFU36_09905 [Sulfolobus sp. A20]